MIGELRMQGKTAEQIADAVNAAGYRTNSKRFVARLFNVDGINVKEPRNEFYAAYESGDDRGTVLYKGERLPGMAALWNVATVEERNEMVKHILEPGGLHYDVETKR